ncbi:MAG: ABC transporter permease [Candidatus Eisenbacteria bacterium]
MGPLLSIARTDLRLTLKERSTLVWMFGMPILFVFFFGTVFGGSSGPPPATRLGISDRDGSFLSGMFVEHLRSEGLDLDLLPAGRADSVAARRAAQKPAEGDPARVLTIPAGFADSLSSGRRAPVEMASASGAGGASDERDMMAQVHLYRAIARTLAILAEIDTAAAPGMVRPEDPAFQTRYRELAALPDPIATVVTTAGKGRAVPSGFAQSAPAMLVLFMLMNTVIYGAAFLTQEKQNRCLRRVESAPVTRGQLLGGKLLGRLGIAMLQAVVLLAAGRLLFGVYWGNSALGLAVLLVCLGLACASLGLLLGSILRSEEQASALGWIVPLFLGAIGGTWWPLEIVPSWMRAAGHVSPAAWAMDGLHGLISFGRGAAAVTVPALVLLGFAAAFFAAGARLLRTEAEG